MQLLILAVVATLAQQALGQMSLVVMPVVAPNVAADLGLDPGFIGVYIAVLHAASIVTSVLSGAFVVRYGGVRVSQIGLLLIVAGLGLALPGGMVVFAASAVLLACGYGPLTPSASQILARHAPPHLTPLVFSIKQTGVPLGGIIAGAAMPAAALAFGWRGAFVAAMAVCLVMAFVVHPLRSRFDQDRRPDHPISVRQAFANLIFVARDSTLRSLAAASFVFGGMQIIVIAFYVTFLVERLGYDLAGAGFLFAVLQGAAMVGRVAWGWLAGRYRSPRVVLGLLGLAMAGANIFFGSLDAGLPTPVMAALAIVIGAATIGWNGVFLAEVALAAPAESVGAVTGGVIAYSYTGSMIYPAVFSAILAATGSYFVGFAAAAVPAALIGVLFLWPRRARA